MGMSLTIVENQMEKRTENDMEDLVFIRFRDMIPRIRKQR